jgi:hypothetical protein
MKMGRFSRFTLTVGRAGGMGLEEGPTDDPGGKYAEQEIPHVTQETV